MKLNSQNSPEIVKLTKFANSFNEFIIFSMGFRWANQWASDGPTNGSLLHRRRQKNMYE